MDHLINRIEADLVANLDEMIRWRRHLHMNPELSFEEFLTAQFIEEKLESFNLEVYSGIGGNGVVAKLKGTHQKPKILLRADFDALPINDEKEVAYKSKKSGKMHACGHDGHTAALLGLAKVLSKYRDDIEGEIWFVFQHAEERPPGGAKSMIESGILNDIDYVYAAHLSSDLPLGTVATGTGYKMAAVDRFKIKIQGKGGHGAKPHHAIDSIVVGSNLVCALQNIISRQTNPLDSAVVTVGMFQAGSVFNAIADSALLEGTVRTFDEDVRDKVEADIRLIVSNITTAFHASAQIEYIRGYPALYNDESETKEATEALQNLFGKSQVVDMDTSMGAEDFSYFLKERLGTYIKVGSRNDDSRTHYPHHHPKFDFDERALLQIAKSFLAVIKPKVL